MARALTPKRMLLDLLRVSPTATPVSGLIEIGALFGFKDSALRVALTRLVAEGRVESDERGLYRRAVADDPKHELIETWRLGDARLRPWSGAFLAVSLPKLSRSARTHSLKALRGAGFVELFPALWVRPDNLSAGAKGAEAQLAVRGLHADAEHFVVDHFSNKVTDLLKRHSWNAREIRQRSARAHAALLRSTDRLAKLPQKEALVEAFLRGGDAIRTLSQDPLLPEEICVGKERRELTAAMLKYDQLGRRKWQELARSRGVELRLLSGQVRKEAC